MPFVYKYRQWHYSNFLEMNQKIANESAEAVLLPPNNFASAFNDPNLNDQLMSKLENRQKIEVGSLENGEITKFEFDKVIKIELTMAFTIAISLFLIIGVMQVKFRNDRDNYQALVMFCLIFNCANTLVAVAISVIRFMAVLNLEKNRKTVYENATIFTTKKILWVALECFIILIQPYPFLEDLYFETSNAFKSIPFMYPVNDLLAILSLIRTYIIFRSLILLTPYMNNRSNRLCKMYGCEASFSFSLKCLFKDNPMLLIMILFSTSALLFSYAIYLAERNCSDPECSDRLASTFSNAVWLILMTITTVGYGDYFPQTPLGRFIIFFVAIWGTFIISIMVVVVSNTLKMEKKEKQASIVIRKLSIREEVRMIASKLIGYAVYRYILFKRSQSKSELHKYDRIVTKLKKQFAANRKKLKSIRNDNDLYDEIGSKFLNLNNDIDILNSNQEKIINFIHDRLEYREVERDAMNRNLNNYRT